MLPRLKLNPSDRNPPTPQPTVQPSGAPALEAPPTQEQLLTALRLSDPQQQKQIIGEHLYPQIYSMHPNLARKITGMLLEMDNSELLHMLEVPESLKFKVEGSVAVLRDYHLKDPPSISGMVRTYLVLCCV